MKEWAQVVTHPLGLSGFALFLIFTYFSRKGDRRRRANDKPSWHTTALLGLGMIALVAGILLDYFEIQSKRSSPEQPSPTTPIIDHSPTPSISVGTIEQSPKGSKNVTVGIQIGGSVTENDASNSPAIGKRQK